jgi:hypothetical protein
MQKYSMELIQIWFIVLMHHKMDISVLIVHIQNYQKQ